MGPCEHVSHIVTARLSELAEAVMLSGNESAHAEWQRMEERCLSAQQRITAAQQRRVDLQI